MLIRQTSTLLRTYDDQVYIFSVDIPQWKFSMSLREATILQVALDDGTTALNIRTKDIEYCTFIEYLYEDTGSADV